MRTNAPFVQGEFAVDYQGVAKDQFLVKGEIAVFSVSLHRDVYKRQLKNSIVYTAKDKDNLTFDKTITPFSYSYL